MNAGDPFINLLMPNRVWIEIHAGDAEARDVIVEMDDGNMYTAVFVTPQYLKRQMELTYDLCRQLPDTMPAHFAALDVPHIVVESLERSLIEDTIDNLLAMEIFEGVFTLVTEDEDEDFNTSASTPTTNGNGRRATQEVAAVVVSDVLVVEEDEE